MTGRLLLHSHSVFARFDVGRGITGVLPLQFQNTICICLKLFILAIWRQLFEHNSCDTDAFMVGILDIDDGLKFATAGCVCTLGCYWPRLGGECLLHRNQAHDHYASEQEGQHSLRPMPLPTQ